MEQQVITALAVVVGTLIGWALSERSSTRRIKAARREAQHDADEARVMTLVRTAVSLARSGYSILDAHSRKAAGANLGAAQYEDEVRRFNDIREDFDLVLAEIRYRGPEWLMQPLAHLENAVRDLIILVGDSEHHGRPVDVGAAKAYAAQQAVRDGADAVLAESVEH